MDGIAWYVLRMRFTGLSLRMVWVTGGTFISIVYILYLYVITTIIQKWRNPVGIYEIM